MHIDIDGRRCLIQWGYELDERAVHAYLRSPAAVRHVPKYSKPEKFGALTFCQIKEDTGQTEPSPEDPSKQRKVYSLVAEGVSPCRREDMLDPYQVVERFDRRVGRKKGLAAALKHSPFTKEQRRLIWAKYNLLWPPVTPEMDRWQRNYRLASTERDLALAQQAILEAENNRLRTMLRTMLGSKALGGLSNQSA